MSKKEEIRKNKGRSKNKGLNKDEEMNRTEGTISRTYQIGLCSLSYCTDELIQILKSLFIDLRPYFDIIIGKECFVNTANSSPGALWESMEEVSSPNSAQWVERLQDPTRYSLAQEERCSGLVEEPTGEDGRNLEKVSERLDAAHPSGGKRLSVLWDSTPGGEGFRPLGIPWVRRRRGEGVRVVPQRTVLVDQLDCSAEESGGNSLIVPQFRFPGLPDRSERVESGEEEVESPDAVERSVGVMDKGNFTSKELFYEMRDNALPLVCDMLEELVLIPDVRGVLPLRVSVSFKEFL